MRNIQLKKLLLTLFIEYNILFYFKKKKNKKILQNNIIKKIN